MAAADDAALAQLLSQPGHRDLRDYALHLERDPARRYEAIRQLGDPHLLAEAVRGKFGEETAEQARGDITELLVQASATAAEAAFTVDDAEQVTIFGTWHGTRQWTPTERALLCAVGHCVRDGVFVHEVGVLMDATDIALRAAMVQLREAGNPGAISTVVGSTFGPFTDRSDVPAASIIAHAINMSRVFSGEAAVVPTATPMWRPNPRCYGRLYMAAMLSHPVRHPDDADNLPDLVETGLSVGGYHLRLELLQAAQFGCHILESDVRQRMIDVLEGYSPATEDWGTSTMLIEALASYGAITPMISLEGIQESIAEILGDSDDPDQRRLARGIVSSMFEDERVLGPYSEAVDSLSDDQRLTLFAMSVLAPDLDHSFSTGT